MDEQLALIRKYLKPNHLTMISDRGTFSVGHLLRLQEAGGSYAICSAPWGEFRERFDAHRKTLIWKKAILFAKFKQQTYSEQINRGFKGPLAVRPVFLHAPERVEALVFLLMGTLLPANV